MGYSTGFWQAHTTNRREHSVIKVRFFITFDLGGKNTKFLAMGNIPNKIIVNYIDIADLQRINYFYPKKYRGKVWKSVDTFTFFVSLQRDLARNMPSQKRAEP
ncbi:MAG: hypothetical protein IKN08_00645 [Bacteroidales bacterium]|nr:hypothetical protein [Bacteroidales bacterium]